MDDIIKRMLAEREDLTRKLTAVDQFLAAYGAGVSKVSLRLTTVRADAPLLARSFADRIDKFGSYGTSVINAALLLLPSLESEPMLTRDLVEKIEARGITIRGENKVNALSALLARSSKIKGHGRAGWTCAVAIAADEYDDLLGADAPKENEPRSNNAGGSDADLGDGRNVTDGLDQPIPSSGSTS